MLQEILTTYSVQNNAHNAGNKLGSFIRHYSTIQYLQSVVDTCLSFNTCLSTSKNLNQGLVHSHNSKNINRFGLL